MEASRPARPPFPALGRGSADHRPRLGASLDGGRRGAPGLTGSRARGRRGRFSPRLLFGRTGGFFPSQNRDLGRFSPPLFGGVSN